MKYIFDEANEMLEKQRTEEASRPDPRTVFRSKRWTVSEDGKERFVHSAIYQKPKLEGEIKGKLNLKYAKRQRVKAMKARQAESA
jgi:hypothetical protein